MPIVDSPTGARRLFDGWSDLSGGVDAGRKSHLIDPNQCVDADNYVFRGGALSTRPAISTVDVTWENPTLTYSGSGVFLTDDGGTNQSQVAFLEGLFQGCLYFAPPSRPASIMTMINGRLYRVTPNESGVGAVVREIGLDRRNRETIPISYFVQAGGFLVVQDGEQTPIIFDGGSARRAIQGEIYRGKAMACGQGRIAMIGTDDLITFFDLRGSHGGGDADMLRADETTVLLGGFPSAIEPQMGRPVGLAFLPQQDALTGSGDLIVYGEAGAEGFTMSLPRSTWQTSQFQRPVLLNIGLAGHRMIASVNNDQFIRAIDGIRSYRQARAEVDKWGHIPLSTNVKQWINADTRKLLSYGSMIEFDNRLITTCTPQPNQGKLFHNGLLSLDFDVISTFGTERQPAWDGHWSNATNDPMVGLRVLQLVKGTFYGQERAFAFVLNHLGHNALVEIQRLPTEVETEGDVTSRARFRSMNFGYEFNEEKIYGGDVWIDEIKRSTTVSFSFSPDQSPTLYPWHSLQVEPLILPEGTATSVSKDGFAPRRSLPKPPDVSDKPATLRDTKRVYEFQVEMTMTGRATARRFRVHSKALTEDSKAKVQ